MASKKEQLFRLPDGTIATLEMHSVEQVLKDKGLSTDGSVQRFHTANVLRRILKYMPMRSGMTIKVTIAQTDIRKPYIITNTPYAQYLRKGKSNSGRALNYTKTKNPLAGPYWDRAVEQQEGAALKADLQRYIDRKSKK